MRSLITDPVSATKSKVSDQQIIESYNRLKAGRKVAKELRISDITVYKVLASHNIPRIGLIEYRKNSKIFGADDIASIVKDYVEKEIAATQLAKSYGCSVWTVINALKNAGVREIRSVAPDMSEDEKLKAKELYLSGLTFAQVAKEVGRHENTILRLMNDKYPEIIRSNLIGPAGPHWMGGRIKNRGYIYVWVAPDDPFAEMASTSKRYVYEHRIVMARKLGRVLRDDETVHHINGDKADNRPENLELRQGKHGKNVVMICLDCGSHNIGHDSLGHKPKRLLI